MAVAGETVVGVGVARRGAAQYLQKFFPGDWVSFSHYVLYDIDAQPGAYALVFRKPTSAITTTQELQDASVPAQLTCPDCCTSSYVRAPSKFSSFGQGGHSIVSGTGGR
jgi:hypothetical protein